MNDYKESDEDDETNEEEQENEKNKNKTKNNRQKIFIISKNNLQLSKYLYHKNRVKKYL